MPTTRVGPGDSQLQDVAASLFKARKVVVVTGAGISTNSGIPDFRSENGLYALIQAQFDAAARQASQDSASGSGSGSSDAGAHSTPITSDCDSDDDRPCKRRKVSLEGPEDEELPFDRDATEDAEETATDCLPARPLHTPRKTRSMQQLLTSPLSSPPLSILPPTSFHHAHARHLIDASIPPSSSPLSSPPPMLLDPFPSSPCSATDESDTETPPSQPLGRSLPNMKGKDLFDASVWADPLRTSVFYTFATSLRQKIKEVKPTPSHRFISHLRDRGKLVRCYTQNIDQIEEKVGLSTVLSDGPGSRGRFSRRSTANASQLSKMVDEVSGDNPESSQEVEVQTRRSGVECVFLHGSLDLLRCFLCGRHCPWDEREAETLSGLQPECPHCVGATTAREERGKRALGVGKLRPDIVLYGEEHPNAHLISPIVTHDLALYPDMMLILGTSLRVHGLKVMVREFAKAVHSKGGKVVFVNFTKPPESSWGDVIDYWVAWDCDAWVEDLQERIPKLWQDPEVMQKVKLPPKNPVAMRDTKATGAYWSGKILEELHRITGTERRASISGPKPVVEAKSKPEKRSRKSAPASLKVDDFQLRPTPKTSKPAPPFRQTTPTQTGGLLDSVKHNPRARRPKMRDGEQLVRPKITSRRQPSLSHVQLSPLREPKASWEKVPALESPLKGRLDMISPDVPVGDYWRHFAFASHPDPLLYHFERPRPRTCGDERSRALFREGPLFKLPALGAGVVRRATMPPMGRAPDADLAVWGSTWNEMPR